MEHNEITISLNFIRKDFEEIYYRQNNRSIFLSSYVRRDLIAFLIVLVLLLCSLSYSLLTDESAWLIVIFSLFTFVLFFPYYFRVNELLKWQKEVKQFLDKNEKIKNNKLIITNNSFTLVQDGEEEIHSWSAITHVEILENYVSLIGKSQYIFTKNSMKQEDFQILIQAINKHVKNGL